METTRGKNTIQTERKQNDLFFVEHFQLPLPPEECLEFECFDYYPPNQK